jgi:hypothetical protein
MTLSRETMKKTTSFFEIVFFIVQLVNPCCSLLFLKTTNSCPSKVTSFLKGITIGYIYWGEIDEYRAVPKFC